MLLLSMQSVSLYKCNYFVFGVKYRLKLHTQANPNCGFLTITNRLEGMLRTKYSMTSLSYSSVGYRNCIYGIGIWIFL